MGSQEKIVIGAVDIGGTKIAVGMVDDTGRVLSKLESPTDAQRGYSRGLERMIGMLRETARVAGVEISGIGIGSTGLVNPISGAFGDVDFLPGWQWKNPLEDLARAFQVSVALENDADASALGEASWGAGKGKSRLVYVTVGTGIGGGIISGGQLVEGDRTGTGHVRILPGGGRPMDARSPGARNGAQSFWREKLGPEGGQFARGRLSARRK